LEFLPCTEPWASAWRRKKKRGKRKEKKRRGKRKAYRTEEKVIGEVYGLYQRE